MAHSTEAVRTTPPSAPAGPTTRTAPADDLDTSAEAVPLTEPKIDAAAPATNTASIPTRLREAPVEHADPHETDEAPYGSPVSASELRRRAADDDE